MVVDTEGSPRECDAVSDAGEAPAVLRCGRDTSRAGYPKLHPGPGHSAEQVVSHQRGRIILAMIDLVAERGYEHVTMDRLAQRAGVSKRTLYERFPSKDGCFLATYDLLAARSIKQVRAAQEGCDGWEERLRLAFGAWTRELAREPRAARLGLVDAFAVGPAALEHMSRAEGLFAALIEQSFAHAPDGVCVPATIVRGIVAGIARVARARLLAGRERELPDLADDFMEWALCFRCRSAAALRRLGDPAPVSAPAAAAAGDDRHPREDDRGRILDAVALLAVRDGYRRLTVPHIRLAAGVSRKRFDEHFADVRECFEATLEHRTERALAHAARVGADGRDWPGGLYRAMHALCAHIATDPVFAKLGFIEIFVPGLEGARCRARLIEHAGEGFRASAPAGQRPSELAAEASVGAAWGIVHQHVAADRAQLLPSLAGMLSFLALAPAIGGEEAVAAIAAEHARMRDAAQAMHPIFSN